MLLILSKDFGTIGNPKDWHAFRDKSQDVQQTFFYWFYKSGVEWMYQVEDCT